MREDLDRLRALSYDEKIKKMAKENQELRKRNGKLLIDFEDTKSKLKDL